MDSLNDIVTVGATIIEGTAHVVIEAGDETVTLTRDEGEFVFALLAATLDKLGEQEHETRRQEAAMKRERIKP